MCLYYHLIPNQRYTPNKKNKGMPPPVLDKRTLYVPTKCGKCIECLKQKARDWQIRLLEEIKQNKNAYFVTLTFSNNAITKLYNESELQGYAADNHAATIATRRFLERWRKTHKRSLRHWLVTELGHTGTENIHLHGILWFQNPQDIHLLSQKWTYGYVYPRTHNGRLTTPNYVNESTVNYITKYITKTDLQHQYYKPKIFTTPGIGRTYMQSYNATKNIFNNENTKQTYTTTTGHQIALPKYYKDKIYTDEQKENLWLNHLIQDEKWILGQKTKNDQDYIQLLKQAQEKNERLKYGNNKTNHEQKETEERRRKKLQQARIQKGTDQ